MDIYGIALAAGIIGATGLLIGILLGVAGKAFAVKVDEKEQAVRGVLPGNNCGGCGFAGCDALAKAIAAGEAPTNGCPVAGPEKAKEIAAIMGVQGGDSEKQVAYVKCNGSCDKTERKYQYYGSNDCRKAKLVPGSGDKSCSYGCMGFGSCVSECAFDAIHIVNGIAVVDKEKCVSCGKCIKACPNSLIEFVPYKAAVAVTCSSKEKGKAVKDACDVGCIGCGICVKQCPSDAITLENNLAHIDQSKCTHCGACAAKCPQKIILDLQK